MKLQSNNITVIGGGTAGHLTVLFLHKHFPNKDITWIFPKDNNPIGVGEASVPYVQNFLQGLGISITDILESAQGNLKLGIKFKKFFDTDRYHPFGNDREESETLLDFMKLNKVPDNIIKYNDIATQFDTTLILPIIYDMVKDNVKILRREFCEKDIKDIVIDCTGFNRHVLSKYNFKGIEQSQKIQNNTALVFKTKKVFNEPYSTFTALSYGWTWKIPLQNKTSFGYVFNSDKISINDAKIKFKKYLKSLNLYEKRGFTLIPMITGRNKEYFIETDNAIITSIGLSSFFIEPLESTGLYFVCYSLNLLKDVINGDITETEYTNIFNKEFDGVIDFILAHFTESTHPEFEYIEEQPELYKDIDIFPTQSWDYLLDEKLSNKEIAVSSIQKLKRI